MTRRTLMLLAAAGSAGILLGAFAFQYIGGLAPCHLCLLQRYPHAVAGGLGVLVLAGLTWRPVALLGAGAALTTAGIGAYHTGVERGFFEGPSDCTGFDIGQMDTSQLLDAIDAAPLVRCDEVPWEMLGLSMASWNVLASLAFAALWLAAFRRAA